MTKSLVVVESPAKSKTISKFLGKDFKVESSMGHLIDLPQSKMGIDLENGFKPQYVVIPSRKKILSKLKKAAEGRNNLYLATDPDREGEAISWHLAKELGKNKKVHRVIFHEITEPAINEAFKHPKGIDMNKVNAQQARRILDRIVGYSLSPLLWKKVSRGLSAGRVQSVAVRLIVEREKQIKLFIPQEYWEIEAQLTKQLSVDSARLPVGQGQWTEEDKKSFIAKLEKIDDKKAEIKKKDNAQKLVEEIKKQIFVVSDIKVTQKKKNPPAPFTTSKLQQDAFNRLRFSASKTMKIAQQLYEGLDIGKEGSVGLITYMRTDSVRVSEIAIDQVRDYISKRFGKKFLPDVPNRYKSKSKSQEAHEAIRPTSIIRTPENIKQYLSDDQYKLYRIIWERFLASQMKPALLEVTSVDIRAGRFLFVASGTKVLFSGFMAVYAEINNENEEKATIPHLETNEKLNLIKLVPSQHFTKPPPRFSDATLVKALEEEGIGRPSTYAPIIQTIVDRNYVNRQSGYFTPTELGIIITDLLMDSFADIMDLKFTAQMETELDQIEEGELKWQNVVNEFYKTFSQDMTKAQANMKNIKKEAIPTDEICAECGSPMVIKWSRKGKFLSCSKYPKCKFAKSITTGIKCPREGCDGELIQRRSRRGAFYGCTRYPDCRYVTKYLPATTPAQKDK